MTTSSTARPATPEPAHACLRCGAPIPLGESLCGSCNPAGLKQPAASQAHGTVYAGIAAAVVAMALAALLLVGGVGPFDASIRSAVPVAGGLRLTLAVTNSGSRGGHASCRVWDPTFLGNPPIETFVRTPEVGPGSTVTFAETVAGLGPDTRPLKVDCSR